MRFPQVRGVVGHQYMMIIAVLGAAWGAVQSMTTLKQLSGNAGRVVRKTHIFCDAILY
jgi:hypothetical protein